MKNFNFDIKSKEADMRSQHNWFLYWKCAPSLWTERLAAYPLDKPLFIPINWSWHHIAPDKIDFGQSSADRDLIKIYQLATQRGLDVVFLLAVSPCPFCPYGGAPKFSSLSIAKNQYNINHASLDEDFSVHNHVSFFDTAVYKAYYRFLKELNRLMSSLEAFPLVLAEYFDFQDTQLTDLYADFSEHFQEGFGRYLKTQDQLEIKTQEQWELTFRREIKDLYSQTAKDIMGQFIQCGLKFAMLGSGTDQLVARSFSADPKNLGFFNHAFTALEWGILPSDLMLSQNEKERGIHTFINKMLSAPILNRYLSRNLSEEEEEDFFPLRLFKLYGLSPSCWEDWTESGLLEILKNRYPGLASRHWEDDIELDEFNEQQYLFFGGDIRDETFHKIINLFLTGANIFLDTARLEEKMLKKLEIFILENNLNIEQVKFVIPIKKASLASGAFFVYCSSDLLKEERGEQEKFWEKIFETLGITHLTEIHKDPQVYNSWMSRSGSPYELSYEEVRRLYLFNPTQNSYRVRVPHHKNFAFIKSLESHKASVESLKSTLEVQMNPESYIELDFGYFSGNNE